MAAQDEEQRVGVRRAASAEGEKTVSFDQALGVDLTVANSPDRAATTVTAGLLGQAELQLIHGYWRAANYLSVGQIYLMDKHCGPSRYSRGTSSRGCWGTGARRRG